MPGRQDKHAPSAIVERRSADGQVELLAESGLVDALVERGLLRDVPLHELCGLVQPQLAGRGRPVLLELRGARVVAKAMLRGGLFGALLGAALGDRFVGSTRVRALVDLLRSLNERGVPTPRLAFARVRRGAAGLVRLDVATHEVAGAQDGHAFLASNPRPSLRREAVRAAARSVRALHDAGVDHADLNVTNLLVRARPPPETFVEAFVIDLEKSRRFDPLPRSAAVQNLARLARSAAKLGLIGTALSRTDLVRFARAYAGQEWSRWFTETRRRFLALLPLHRIHWAWRGRGLTRRADGRGSPAPRSTTRATLGSP